VTEEVDDEVDHISFGDDFVEYIEYFGSPCCAVRFSDIGTSVFPDNGRISLVFDAIHIVFP